MRAPAVTVSEPAFRSPIITPVCSKSTREASVTFPPSSPAIVTLSARTPPVSLAPASMVRSPWTLTSPLNLPAMRTLPPPSILPSMVMSAAISDSWRGRRGWGRTRAPTERRTRPVHSRQGQPRRSAGRLDCLSRWTWRRTYQEGGLLRLALKGDEGNESTARPSTATVWAITPSELETRTGSTTYSDFSDRVLTCARPTSTLCMAHHPMAALRPNLSQCLRAHEQTDMAPGYHFLNDRGMRRADQMLGRERLLPGRDVVCLAREQVKRDLDVLQRQFSPEADEFALGEAIRLEQLLDSL